MMMQNNDLSPDERDFRSLLLESAKRLDMPSPESFPKALARVELHASARTGNFARALARRGVLMSCVGLAAGAFLYLRPGSSPPRIVAKAEPVAQARDSTAQAVTQPSATTATLSTALHSVPPLKAPPTRGIAAKPRVVAVNFAPTPSKGTVPGLAAREQNPDVDQEQTFLVRQSLEHRGVPPELMAPQGAQAARTNSGSSSATPIIVWDGDQIGLNASGWSAPNKTVKTIAVVPNVGFAQSRGLVWQAQGSQWMGFGWNWFSWWPSEAGTDITQRRQLVFRLRIDAKLPEQQPEPIGFMVALSSSTGTAKRSTGSVQFARSDLPNLCDGSWHKIAVPLSELVEGDNVKGFDATHAWEFVLGYWSPKVTTFTAYVDDIGFE